MPFATIEIETRMIMLAAALQVNLIILPITAKGEPIMPEPIYTLFTFDVEDTWYEDEIGAIVPTYLAETLTKHGIRAHFLLIGDRWRRIKERKEHRFVDALEHHDIGLHSDNAIEGPFISEVVADADWDQGVAIARSYEGRGLIAVEEACGRQASAISRHAHISGGPFSYEFARQKGLFYHYGYTPNPMGDVAPIWVAGALASDVEGPNYVTIHDCKYRSEETYQAEIKKFTDHVTRLQEEKVRFQTAFLGHPYCYMSHNGHVGSYYRYNGRSPRSIPETLAYMETLPCRRFPMSHLDDIKRRFRNTVEVIAGLRDQGLIKDVTTAELRDVFGKRPETMTLQQLQSFAKRIPHNGIDLPNPDIFTLGEYLLAMLECIERFNSSGTMPGNLSKRITATISTASDANPIAEATGNSCRFHHPAPLCRASFTPQLAATITPAI